MKCTDAQHHPTTPGGVYCDCGDHNRALQFLHMGYVEFCATCGHRLTEEERGRGMTTWEMTSYMRMHCFECVPAHEAITGKDFLLPNPRIGH